jgi:hypothetical protein
MLRDARRCIGDILSAHTHAEVRGRPGEHVNHAGRVLLLLRRFSCGLDLFSFLRALSSGPGKSISGDRRAANAAAAAATYSLLCFI